MPCPVRRFVGVKALRRPPLTPANAPLVRPTGEGSETTQRSRTRRETTALLCALPALGLYDIAFHAHAPDPLPYLANGFAIDNSLTYVIPAGAPDAWRAKLTTARRGALKKAHAEAAAGGVRVEADVAMEDVAPLFVATARVKGYGMSGYAGQLPHWWRQVRSRQAGCLYAMTNERDERIGVTALVWDHHTAYYLGGGMKQELRDASRLNSLLFERMISDAHARGLDFDFEGSRIPGVERFFREWGGELRLTYRALKIPSPLIYAAWVTQRYFERNRSKIRGL